MSCTLLLDIRAFIGHFHPVIVHLPIGMLILAIVLQGAGRNAQKETFHKAISISFLLGAASAVLACISGYLLSISDNYEPSLAGWHLALGIGVAISSIVLYILHTRRIALRWQWPLGLALGILIIITGHLGGSLTHGSGYLTQSLFTGDDENQSARKPIADVQEALVYQDLVQPLLREKCYSCHNANKRKGGLQMDQADLLMKGGKNGEAIVAGKPDQSEMIRRMQLPREHEDHMPPKEKPQPTERDLALLQWWIACGASFDKQVKELDQPEKIRPVLLALQNPEVHEKDGPDMPSGEVPPADASALQKLRDAGVVILPVAQNSNYLVANFVSAPNVGDSLVAELLALKEQLTWLKLGHCRIGNTAMQIIGQCTNLTRLQLEHTAITDSGLTALRGLRELRYLNLVGTKVTASGVRNLAALPKLRSLYLYQTQVQRPDWGLLQSLFPKTRIDSGGYLVPLLATDTTRVIFDYNKN